MTSQWTRILNVFALFFLLILSGGLQTTLWFQFFGHFPAPQFWLVLIVYVILYRSPRISLVLTYLMGFGILSFSALSLGMLWINLLFLYIVVLNFKSRFYWGGVGYFTLMCLIASSAFHLFYLGSSYIFEAKPAEILFWQRFGEIVLTPVFAIPYFLVLKQLDRWTIIEETFAEPGGFDV